MSAPTLTPWQRKFLEALVRTGASGTRLSIVSRGVRELESRGLVSLSGSVARITPLGRKALGEVGRG